MKPKPYQFSRRSLLKGGLTTAAAAGLMPALSRTGFGQSFPQGNIEVLMPTEAGGSADLTFRRFSPVWGKYLNTNFGVDFFPGASGRVGYEVYISQREPNGHNLLFGNMGAEVAVLVVQEAEFGFPQDIQYFSRVSIDPSVLFVAEESPFQTVEDVIEEGRRRTLTVATSRLPHPASIGALLLAEETGADFNLIPVAGGRNTIAAVVTGETDFGVLSAGTIAGTGVRTLLVWHDENPVPHDTNDAPTMNDHFGTNVPPLVSAWAFGVHTRFIEEHPDLFEILENTSRQAFEDPEYEQAVRDAHAPLELMSYGDHEECTRMAASMVELSERFKPLLTGEA
jgi:putative tricarboxylic transport membrane protein